MAFPFSYSSINISLSDTIDDILDRILDIEDVEVDPINRQFGDTPLHSAVKYSINEPELGAYLGKSFLHIFILLTRSNNSFVFSIVEMLIEAGADPTLRNKDGQTPLDLAPSTNDKLIEILQGAEMARQVAPEGKTCLKL